MSTNTAVLHTTDIYPESVKLVVPLIIEMLNPRSVVDFGCGVGCWLQEFKCRNVSDILGIDGPYLKNEDLLIPREVFVPWDLERVRELQINRKFDVAICLECAEHLHAETAPWLVETLCTLATHVVFSAAIPGQTGMGHLNEQYPDYWQKLFANHKFQMYDYFRPRVWNEKKIEFWYRQNMYLFSKAPDHFLRPTSRWDGSVYITRDLLEMYVDSFETRNADRIINKKNIKKLRYLSVRQCPTVYRRVFNKLRRLPSDCFRWLG